MRAAEAPDRIADSAETPESGLAGVTGNSFAHLAVEES